MTATATPTTKVITPAAMLSYPHVDKQQPVKQGESGTPKYSATFVFKPGTDLSALMAVVLAAAEAKWPGKGTEMLRTGAIRSPFRKDAEAKGYEVGSIFVNARSEQKPGAVYSYAATGTTKPAIIPDDKIREELYPGSQVRASLNAFAYDRNGNKGVSFALNNIQKIGEGTRLDSRRAADDEFTADLSAPPADLSSLI